MAYFKHLPDILYQSPLSHKTSSSDYINVKNIFRRSKLKDYLAGNVSLFNKYIIEDGERPDTISESLYGSPQYDFVVILAAGITNINHQWPVQDYQIYDIALAKYGSEEKMNENHHYETYEIKDSKGRQILPPDLIVDVDFKMDGSSLRYPTNRFTGENMPCCPDPCTQERDDCGVCVEIGSGDDRVILKKGASGDIEQQRKLSGVKQTATKPFLIGVHNSGDITEGGSNKFYTDARVQAYLTGQGIVNQTSVIAAITDSAPAALDTLNELAAAIGDDENFSTTITNSIATKAPKASPIFTGTVTGVTGSFSGSLALSADSSQLQLGTGNRAQIFHNSAALYLRSSTGGVIVQGPTLNHYSSDATTLYFSSASGGLSFGGTKNLHN